MSSKASVPTPTSKKDVFLRQRKGSNPNSITNYDEELPLLIINNNKYRYNDNNDNNGVVKAKIENRRRRKLFVVDYDENCSPGCYIVTTIGFIVVVVILIILWLSYENLTPSSSSSMISENHNQNHLNHEEYLSKRLERKRERIKDSNKNDHQQQHNQPHHQFKPSHHQQQEEKQQHHRSSSSRIANKEEVSSTEITKTISCLDMFNNTINGIINDNYCDCSLTGEDEPNTSACSNILLRPLFICNPDDPLLDRIQIYTSRITDGIIDCPNGSDEYDDMKRQIMESQ